MGVPRGYLTYVHIYNIYIIYMFIIYISIYIYCIALLLSTNRQEWRFFDSVLTAQESHQHTSSMDDWVMIAGGLLMVGKCNTGWWFQILFIFIIWGNDPSWVEPRVISQAFWTEMFTPKQKSTVSICPKWCHLWRWHLFVKFRGVSSQRNWACSHFFQDIRTKLAGP